MSGINVIHPVKRVGRLSEIANKDGQCDGVTLALAQAGAGGWVQRAVWLEASSQELEAGFYQ